jgi:hypothetical protein
MMRCGDDNSDDNKVRSFHPSHADHIAISEINKSPVDLDREKTREGALVNQSSFLRSVFIGRKDTISYTGQPVHD